MINLINKVLARFHLKLVSTKPVSLVDETVKFLNTISKGALGDVDMSGYIGDVDYVTDKTGKTYFHQIVGTKEKYFCDKEEILKQFLEKKVDKEEETVFTPEELQEKLNEN